MSVSHRLNEPQRRLVPAADAGQTRAVVRSAFWISLLLAVASAHAASHAVVLTGASVFAILGARQAIQALTISVLLRFINPTFMGEALPGVALLGWLVVLAAIVGVLREMARTRPFPMPVMPWLTIFALVILVLSVFFSGHPLVSIFKIVSFALAFATTIAGVAISSRNGFDWTPWFVGMWVAVVFLSLPTLALPQIGYARDGEGFQGVLNHPQAFAVFLAPMIAWLVGASLFHGERRQWWLLLFAALAIAMLFLTRGRTGLAALGGGLLAVLLMTALVRLSWFHQFVSALINPVVLALLYLGAVALVAISSVAWDFLVSFVLKGQEANALQEVYHTSRGFLLEQSWANFLGSPLTGIGFGVAESATHAFTPVIEPITGLPLSAVTEKSNLVVAILEETGIIGTLAFVPFVVMMVRQIVQRNNIVLAWVFFTAMFTNVSEMIFFSASGLGQYIWLLIGWAIAHNAPGANSLGRQSS